jgi:hypothetical protein
MCHALAGSQTTVLQATLAVEPHLPGARVLCYSPSVRAPCRSPCFVSQCGLLPRTLPDPTSWQDRDTTQTPRHHADHTNAYMETDETSLHVYVIYLASRSCLAPFQQILDRQASQSPVLGILKPTSLHTPIAQHSTTRAKN